ncbi:MAG: UDP-N-acetylmuramoyl-tripeptide--D-alanyl-D-alanine ligase [Thermoanaerobaculia bacterium]|nr:UDP-N-acetylmuramoyl-tripeptide--D-alanyl-D-alanine ligase [Thermoanaerobaculia bacterium]
MVCRTVAEAARAMAGSIVLGDPERRWEGARLDSRQVEGGELFFALPGSQRDGHEFVPRALAQGAAAVVVAHEVAPQGAGDGAIIRVDDPYRGLHALTRVIRNDVPERLVAITGSNGKTTTKELLATLLGARYRVARSPGNLNNTLGFPIALLGIPDDSEWMVAEMGLSVPGELRETSLLGRPDVAVFTNVRPVHLETLGTIEDVAAAKAELLAGLVEGGLVVANADDPWVRKIVERAPGPVVWYGIEADVEYRAIDIVDGTNEVGSRFRWMTPAGDIEVYLPLHGRYNIENFLAAASCAHRLGVGLAEIAAQAGGLTPVAGRGVVRTLASGIRLIDDSYNSNPVALRRSLESASRLPATRRLAVLGDMLELGPDEAAFHDAEGRAAVELGFGPIAGVGALSRRLVEGVRNAGGQADWFATAAEAADWLQRTVQPGDLVLVKGSRGIGLEAVVQALAGGVD